MANMMASPQLHVIAESGYGITLAGFYCPTNEFDQKLLDLKGKVHNAFDFASWEYNGYVAFIACARNSLHCPSVRQFGTIRREPHKLFQDLPAFLKNTKAQWVDRIILTGSLGSISLSVLYRPADTDCA